MSFSAISAASWLTLAGALVSAVLVSGGPVPTPTVAAQWVAGGAGQSGTAADLLAVATDTSRGRFWNRPLETHREFYFTRAVYRDNGWDMFRRFSSWRVDYPKADLQFLLGLKRLVNHLDAYDYENPMRFTDPNLARYPFLYAVEVGYMRLNELEVRSLRRYLLAGGFLLVDDFWGTREWANFEAEIRRVLPEYPIVDVSLDHPIFHSFYDVEKLVQVPNVGQGVSGGPTWEKDGYTPHVRGIFDDQERLLVAISFNCDLGDAWEWAEDPYYPLEYSSYAYQMGVNLILYAMSH